MPKVYDVFNNPPAVGYKKARPTGVQQHFKEQCNINDIMARFKKTGVLPVVQTLPIYGDFTTVESFQSAVDRIKTAENIFKSLPARIRDRFNNNPGDLIAFIQDEKNREEAIELGFIAPPEKPAEVPKTV